MLDDVQISFLEYLRCPCGSLCLPVAGAFVPGVHYYAVDLRAQKALCAPKNRDDMDF